MSSSYTPFPGTSSVDAEGNECWLDRAISLISNRPGPSEHQRPKTPP